jgi:hypothetical protein
LPSFHRLTAEPCESEQVIHHAPHFAKLDAGEQPTPDFSRTARDVVETGGPTTVHPSGPAVIAQAGCRQLALNMLDTIEGGKMSTRAFT